MKRDKGVMGVLNLERPSYAQMHVHNIGSVQDFFSSQFSKKNLSYACNS